MDSQERRELLARRLNPSGAHANSPAASPQPNLPTWTETQGTPPAPPPRLVPDQDMAALAGNTRRAIHVDGDTASVQHASLALGDAHGREFPPRSEVEKGNGNARTGAGGFSNAIRAGFGKYVDFSGRASRSEYWWWAVFHFLVTVVVVLPLMMADPSNALAFLILYWGVTLALFLPSFAVMVRRLHDTDRSGWWVLISAIPLIGAFVLLFWLARSGTRGPNRFGPPPLGSSLQRGYDRLRLGS